MSELEKFRREARDWIIENCPATLRDGETGIESICWGGDKWVFTSSAQKHWLECCREKGWTVPTWPKEYGGAGLSSAEGKVIEEEMSSLDARLPLYNMGIVMLGPVLLKYGTHEQKLMHLPEIASGKVRWCQGYSEPNAGSDLASLNAKCEDIGDAWLINGQKTWTSSADKADWIFVLVRGDNSVPKHQGINFLLLPVDCVGITPRPIELISGKSPFCEVFFEDVKVPKEYGENCPSMVGDEGRGWEVATYLLKFERGGLAGLRDKDVDLVGQAVQVYGIDNNGRLKNGVFRSKLVKSRINEATFEAASGFLRGAKGDDGAMSSVMKYYGSQLIQREFEIRMDLGGSSALELQSDAEGELSQKWLYSRAYTIFGGTSEIQLNILSKRVLKLPGK